MGVMSTPRRARPARGPDPMAAFSDRQAVAFVVLITTGVAAALALVVAGLAWLTGYPWPLIAGTIVVGSLAHWAIGRWRRR